VPAAFILLAVLLARGYPISRERHAEVRRLLDARHDAQAAMER